MKEQGITDLAMLNLEKETGIKTEWVTRPGKALDGELYLVLNEQLKKHFYVEVKKQLMLHQLENLAELATMRNPLLVIAEYIPPKMKEMMRARKLAYLDAAGNIFIHDNDIYIRIDGNKYTPPVKTGTNRAFTKTGLKAVFHFLRYPEKINDTYQEIANTTGIAIGNIRNILDGLTEGGYIDLLNKKTMRLVNKKALFERWLTGYGEILKPSLLIGKYHMTNHERFTGWQLLPREDYKTFWGGEPAAALLTNNIQPEILTVYTEDTNYPFMAKWKMVPAAHGEIHIYKKFWKENDIFTQDIAPYLLIYADLLLTNDPRNIEIAGLINQMFLNYEY